jgi:elongation factor P
LYTQRTGDEVPIRALAAPLPVSLLARRDIALISTSDFKSGLTFELDGQVYMIVTSEFYKPGKGQAVVRTKVRDIKTGNVYSKTFKSGEKFERAHVEHTDMQFLYSSAESYTFMDMESYEQIDLPAAAVEGVSKWFKEGESVQVIQYEGELIGVEVANTVERRVTQTDPGLRGDTAQGGTKPATVEGGAIVTVPLFINIGDVLKIDTRSGEYVERASTA